MSQQPDLRSFFEKPVPYLTTAKDKWLFIWFINLFCALFLLIFQPFGVNNYDPTHKIRLSLLIGIGGFTLVNVIVMALFEFGLGRILWKKPNRKALGIRMFFLLILLSTSTFITYNWMGNFHDWSWRSYLGFIRDIGLMSVIPVTLLILYLNQRQIKKQNEYLLRQPIQALNPTNIICLVAENEKDKLCIPQVDLVLLEAQDNYVAVFHLEQQALKKTLLRSTLKKLEAQLKESSLIRCHRSYIVNSLHIQKAKGNSHQLQLTLMHYPNTIPVSRTYTRRILEPLDAHPA